MRFEVTCADEAVAAAARRRVDSLAKPLGSLGRLESLAVQLCATKRTLSPRIDRAAVLVFAADHGLSHAGVSAYPREVTAQVVRSVLAGGAAISVLGRTFGADARLIDAGVDGEFAPHPCLLSTKVAQGTADVLGGDAMTQAQCEQAIAAGAAHAREALADGADVIALGEIGIGNTAIAALLLHGLTCWPLERCVGRGSGLDEAGVAHKLEVIRRVAERISDRRARGPVELIAQWGGFEFAMLSGAILAAAERRAPVLIDGFAVTVAAALAARIAPAALDYCIFAHVSAEKAHRDLLVHLGATSLLDLGMCLGEGTGAMLALPIVRAAAVLFTEMATLEGAGVSDRAQSPMPELR